MLEQARKRELNERDLLATATALTAHSIAQAYENFVADKIRFERLVLGGGGSDNSFLIKQLQFIWPHPVNFIRHETLGISTKFKESLLFA
ncbi:anhydro-N-acetylmuramic acid kinase, partial [Acinetobacter baumannii]